MKIPLYLRRHLFWLNLPSTILIALLQRTPALRLIVVGEEMVIASPLGTVLKSALATVAALGTVHTLAGATELSASSPSPLTVSVGSSVSVAFSVNGTTSAPDSWDVSGLPPGLSSSGSDTLIISGTATTAGTYNVSLTANDSTGASANFNYTIIVTGSSATAPAFTSHPSSQSVNVGSGVTFSASANGSPAPGYQWFFNGGPIGGATGSSYSIGSAQVGNSGTYFVRASNSAGSVDSNGASLTVTEPNVAPSVFSHPASQTVTAGANVSFSVGASGTPAPGYQWQKDGSDIGGATGATLTLFGVQSSAAGTYRVLVANAAGSVFSNGATLVVNTPPGITSQPVVSQTVNAGTAVSFTVTAGGTAPLSYQWKKDGGNISGASSATYTINSAVVGDAGTYTVVVSNMAGSVTSNGSVLAINVAPVFTTQPSAQTVSESLSAQFTAAASGTPTPAYQWQRLPSGSGTWADIADGGGYAGATTGTLMVSATTMVMNGDQFRCVATNSVGNATSTVVTLAVNARPPVITAEPDDQTIVPGATVNLAVTISGTAPLSYQWKKGAADIGGATIPTLTLTNFQSGDAATYNLLVSNTAGTATASIALTLLTPPIITAHPAATSGPLGDNASFSVAATSGLAPIYQWERLPAGSGTWSGVSNGGIYSGATSATLTITGLPEALNGDQFRVVVTNGAGAATSNAAVLTVVIPVPVITAQPQGVTANLGSAVNFSVTTTSPVGVSYQWQKGGADISGATSATYNIPSFQSGDVGNYRVVVTNSGGATTSSIATLAVAVSPAITTQPANQTVISGASASFTVTVTSNAPPSYQWKKNGADISGATNATLNLSNVQGGDQADYSVVVTNIAGTITSNVATLTVQLPPVITAPPAAASALPTTSVTFTVAAISTTTLSYQWQRLPLGSGSWDNVTDSSGTYGGATTAQLTAGNVQLANSGEQYRCIVSNVAGAVTSNPATLTVAAAGFTKLSAGRYHSVRVNTVSQLYASGTNTQGQLGTGNTASTTTAQLVTLGGQTITDAAAGAEHSLFLTSAKEVWATGLNSTGQLGDGTTTAKATPIKLATNAVGIAVGNFHSVVLKTDGSLWTVGGNDSGQLGNGTTTDTTTLAQVATSVVHAVAGIRQTLFLKSDGTLWAMGNLDGGDIGVSTPIQIATNVKTMAAGGYHSLFVKTDGTLWAMGYNPSGQLGTGDTTTRTTPVQVATGVEAVSAGYFFSVYLKTDRSLWAMGNNGGGQLGDGTTTARSTAVQVATNVATVATGENYTLFTKTDGTLWGTGYTANGQFGNGTTASLSTPAQLAAGVVLVPEAPTGLTATVATSPERAQLTWTPQGAATSYEVWRHTANDSASATRIAANQRWALYEDLAVTPGQAYYYWVKAVNSAGTSAVSAMATTASTLSQTITFNPLPDVAYSTTPITLSATASSSLPVTFSVVAGPATVTGSSLTLTGVGAVTVRASQAGNSAYDPAPNVARSFAVSKASAAVTLGSLSATYDGTPKSATATTNPSGLTVGFTYDGSATAPMNAGSYAVVGTIADALYQGSASGTLTIAPAAQTITFDPLADRGYTATPISLSATASSGLTVTFSVVTGPATVSGNSLTLNGAGTVTVRAEQVGNASYSAATAVERSFTVTANFDSWRLDHFTAPERADMNVSGPNAVFGQDGLPNLVKYALGLDPKVNATSGLPEVTTTATDWVYTFKKQASATDVTCTVETSMNLTTWTTSGVTLTLVSTVSGVETWEAKLLLTAAPNTFFRLKVTQ